MGPGPGMMQPCSINDNRSVYAGRGDLWPVEANLERSRLDQTKHWIRCQHPSRNPNEYKKENTHCGVDAGHRGVKSLAGDYKTSTPRPSLFVRGRGEEETRY